MNHPTVDLKGKNKKEQAYTLFEAGYTVLDEVCSLTGIKPSTVQVYYNKWLVETGRREPRYSKKHYKFIPSDQYIPVLSGTPKTKGLEVNIKGAHANYSLDTECNLTVITNNGTLVIPNRNVKSIISELSQIKDII